MICRIELLNENCYLVSIWRNHLDAGDGVVDPQRLRLPGRQEDTQHPLTVSGVSQRLIRLPDSLTGESSPFNRLACVFYCRWPQSRASGTALGIERGRRDSLVSQLLFSTKGNNRQIGEKEENLKLNVV